MIMNNYSVKKKILAAALICGVLSAWPLYKTFETNTQKKLMLVNAQPSQEQIQTTIIEINSAESTVAETVHKEFNDEHDQLLLELQSAFPLTDNKWATMNEELSVIKSQDDLLIENPEIVHAANDHEIVIKVREILASYGINPARVNVYTVDEPSSGSFASAGQGFDGTVIHELKINIAKLPNLTSIIQEAIIRHEIMHLLHYDSLEHSFIVSTLEENGIEPKVYRLHPTFTSYCKHKELRADLTAASDNLEIAQAFQDDFLNRFNENPENYAKVYASHPSLKQRHEAVSQLAQYLQAEKQVAVA